MGMIKDGTAILPRLKSSLHQVLLSKLSYNSCASVKWIYLKYTFRNK